LSLAGKLEDVPLADVMQFIHLGRRTGNLSVERDDARAEIQFHEGAIVGARSPGSLRLGELLVEEGVLEAATLEEVLARQERPGEDRALGLLLLDQELVSRDEVRDAIRSQIERTIYELVTWSHGSFVFELEDLEPMDDVAVFPGDLVPDIDLNTQMVLLEAARIFDERNRSGEEPLDDTTSLHLEPKARRKDDKGRSAEPLAATPATGAPSSPDEERKVEEAEALFMEMPDLPPPPEIEEPGEKTRPAPPSDAPERLFSAATSLRSALGEGETRAPDRPAEGEVEKTQPIHSLDDLLEAEDQTLVLHLVDPERDGFGPALATRLETLAAEILRVPSADAGAPLDGKVPAAVAYHVTEPADLEHLADLTRRHPGVPVICILDDVTAAGRAYAAGAAAVVPREVDAVVRCFESLGRFRTRSGAAIAIQNRSAYARLRRVVADLRSGLFSASVALNLMNVIAESVERAVLFLVRRETLASLGAFGFDQAHRPLAEVTRGIAVERSHDNALTRAVASGQALTTTFADANLPQPLMDVLGQPVYDEVVIFPVLGSDRVILVIYTDNGHLDRPIEEVDFLDLAAAEVGIAFENELLRRQLSDRGGG
jgi:hypothetical protein